MITLTHVVKSGHDRALYQMNHAMREIRQVQGLLDTESLLLGSSSPQGVSSVDIDSDKVKAVIGSQEALLRELKEIENMMERYTTMNSLVEIVMPKVKKIYSLLLLSLKWFRFFFFLLHLYY
jgi:hypothetical protein